MKPLYPVLFFLLLAPAFAGAQAISINTDASNPDPSAILDVKSTDKGVLVPRMNTAQRELIAVPATGLLVFDTDSGDFWFYNGVAWTNLSAGGGTPTTFIADTDNNTKVQTEASPNEDIIRFDLGGTEAMVLRKNSNGATRIELPDAGNSTIIGHEAGVNNVPVAGVSGENNTFLGYCSGNANTTGGSNVATGASSLYSNTSGSLNTANGLNALYNNTTGNENTAIGSFALTSNTTGQYNTANGSNSLLNNTSGQYNTATGTNALRNNATGFSNTAVGTGSLFNNTDRSNLVAVGDSALYNNGVGATQFYHAIFNTAVGSKALYSNTTGSWNTANGYEALWQNTTGNENTANGYRSLYSNTTGSKNTAVGFRTLHNNTEGNENTANGYDALWQNTTGFRNTANGYSSLYYNTTGNGNTANGRNALYQNTIGNENTANGGNALYDNTTGNENTANGYWSLSNNSTGNNNTALGHYANVATGALVNATAIGSKAYVSASNSMVLGSINGTYGATSSVKVGIGVTDPSHYLTVKSPDTETMRLIGPTSNFGYGARLNFGDGDIVYIDEPTDDEMRIQANFVGIGRTPTTNRLEVEGAASKSAAGDWLANSDARLKKNIQPLNSHGMLNRLLALQGVTYEWNDDKTGSKRPEGVQYGFTAQNIQTVFPTLVEEDKLGYLQTAYGTYDAMTVEAIRALHEKITALEAENVGQKALLDLQKKQLDAQSAQLKQITAALQTAGIGVGN